jgi:hypothetical protein
MNVLLRFLFRFLEVIFFVGIAGSLVVLAITTVEDIVVLFEKDEPAPGTTSAVATQRSAAAHTD